MTMNVTMAPMIALSIAGRSNTNEPISTHTAKKAARGAV